MSAKRDLSSDLKTHLKRKGIILGLNHDEAEARIEQALGPERYRQCLEAYEQLETDGGEMSNIYSLFQTPEEANLYFSDQSDILFGSSLWFTEQIAKLAAPPQRIADLGCAMGVFTTWIAEEYPQAEVVGVDCEETFLRLARDAESPPNVRYLEWDYEQTDASNLADCDVLVSGLGIHFRDHEAPTPLDISSYRTGERYDAYRQQSVEILKHWRTAARTDASLFAVLRIYAAVEFIAFIDAAHETGWTFLPGASTMLPCDDEQLPAMTLQNRSSPPPDERDVLGFWLATSMDELFERPFQDDMAVAVYHSLADRQVLKSETRRDADGAVIQCDIGTAGVFAFLFAHDTAGFGRLKLLPRHHVENLSPKFYWK